MKRTASLVLLAAFLAVSCEKQSPLGENDILPENGPVFDNEVVMSAPDVLFGMTKSSASSSDRGLSFRWNDGDKVGVYTKENGFALYTLSEGAQTSLGVFDGSGFALKEGSTYHAFYPYNGNATDRTRIPVDYTAQKISGSDNADDICLVDYLAASAVANSKGAAEFKFSHLGAFAKISVKSDASSEFSSLDLVPEYGSFVGSYDYNINDGSKSDVKAVDRIHIPVSGISPSQNKDASVWVALAPKDLSKDKIGVILSDGKEIYSSRLQGEDFTKGRAYRMKDFSDGSLVRYTVGKSDVSSAAKTSVSLTSLGIPAGQYSAIVKVRDNRYAVVHDKAKGSGIYFLDLEFDKEGVVTSASISLSEGSSKASDTRDVEGIALVGDKFYVSAEDQKILEYDLDGYPTGVQMAVPEDMDLSHIQNNLGFEALTSGFDKDGKAVLWFTTESSLLRDKDALFGAYGPLLRLQSVDVASNSLSDRRLYLMDAPKITSPAAGSTYVHGVSDMLGLPDGRVIVLEREVYASLSSLSVSAYASLYIVDPINDNGAVLSKRKIGETITTGIDMVSKKITMSNFEGMCWGPVLEDGRKTILLVNDSQGGQKFSAGFFSGQLEDFIKTIVVDL